MQIITDHDDTNSRTATDKSACQNVILSPTNSIVSEAPRSIIKYAHESEMEVTSRNSDSTIQKHINIAKKELE
jgi:hypothetical protein